MNTKPTWRLAAELRDGDTIVIKNRAGGSVGSVAHVEPYTETDRRRVLVVLEGGTIERFDATERVDLADDERAAAARMEAFRTAAAGGLRHVADLIHLHALPVDGWSVQVSWMPESGAEVRAAAKRLGVEVDEPRPDHHHVGFSYEFGESPRIRLRLHAIEAPAEPSTVDTEQSDVIERIGVASEIAAREESGLGSHFEARGWKGTEPGSCGVECACGTTYDGFDSLDQAAALLARHIEEGNAAGARPSVEDAPPRGSDAAEERAPKPATVEGHGHQRGESGFTDEPAADEAPTRPSYDPNPTIDSRDPKAYETYARHLDTWKPGWWHDDTARMAAPLAALAEERRVEEYGDNELDHDRIPTSEGYEAHQADKEATS